jgi:hypothetical protein
MSVRVLLGPACLKVYYLAIILGMEAGCIVRQRVLTVKEAHSLPQISRVLVPNRRLLPAVAYEKGSEIQRDGWLGW